MQSQSSIPLLDKACRKESVRGCRPGLVDGRTSLPTLIVLYSYQAKEAAGQ